MKTAKEILYDKCSEYNDGMMSGQVKWIVEAMEEYAQHKISLPKQENVIDSAYFTKFERGTNWCSGKIGKYNFEAKLFDEGSTFGIKNGRVSKLAIWDEEIRQKEQNFFKSCIVNYDRGWDIKPNKEFMPCFDAVMTLLENAPKRFS